VTTGAGSPPLLHVPGSTIRITQRRHSAVRRATVVAALVAFGGAELAAAQSASELGAWDALMLSPFGAFAPLVGNDAGNRRPTELSVRYGRWEFSDDDAAHNNFGLTLARALPFAGTEIALTGAYLSVQCGDCPSWFLGGVDVESGVWRHLFSRSGRQAMGSVRVRASVAGARNSETEPSNARSAALSVPIGLGIGVGRYSVLDAEIVPGIGYGRIAGPGRLEGGYRPALGGVLSWQGQSGLGVHLGVQEIFVHRGPITLGVGLSWGMGARGPAPP
jgi:hypothetical protein